MTSYTYPTMRLLPLVFLLTSALPAQWDLQPSHTTASLRGIHALGGGVAWASGSEGTVLRTTDDGLSWQRCPTPPAAEQLDFRGIQAFDASTALVMSSGKGDLSRLYKTTDACQSWKLVFTNPDKEGFWDALQRIDHDGLEITGDSVDRLLVNDTQGHIIPVWQFREGSDPADYTSESFFELAAKPKEGSFAASNSTLVIGTSPHHDPIWRYQWLASQTINHSYIHIEKIEETNTCEPCRMEYMHVETPMSQESPNAGIFSLAFREDTYGVAVGGDYTKPDKAIRTAIFSSDSGTSWQHAQTPPHGYRSAVAYAPEAKAWITVGPNGTDLSTDDGRNWRALKPGPADPPGADKNWNALSLPFAVGPQGRIGRLRPDALPK